MSCLLSLLHLDNQVGITHGNCTFPPCGTVPSGQDAFRNGWFSHPSIFLQWTTWHTTVLFPLEAGLPFHASVVTSWECAHIWRWALIYSTIVGRGGDISLRNLPPGPQGRGSFEGIHRSFRVWSLECAFLCHLFIENETPLVLCLMHRLSENKNGGTYFPRILEAPCIALGMCRFQKYPLNQVRCIGE